MALQKNRPTPSGKTLTYHRIGAMRYDAASQTALVRMESKENAGAAPSVFLIIELTGLESAPTEAEAYELLKARPEWSGATDV